MFLELVCTCPQSSREFQVLSYILSCKLGRTLNFHVLWINGIQVKAVICSGSSWPVLRWPGLRGLLSLAGPCACLCTTATWLCLSCASLCPPSSVLPCSGLLRALRWRLCAPGELKPWSQHPSWWGSAPSSPRSLAPFPINMRWLQPY